jgi:hypothetical protein
MLMPESRESRGLVALLVVVVVLALVLALVLEWGL